MFFRFSDPKGFRYMEFLQAIDTSYFAHRLPTYPVTIATMEKWKHRRAWYPEVIPQNPHQDYQGPEAAVEKCRKNIAINRLRVSDFFIDQDFHHRGTVTRKQFRRATALMRLGLTPIENLILEDRSVPTVSRSNHHECAVLSSCLTLDPGDLCFSKFVQTSLSPMFYCFLDRVFSKLLQVCLSSRFNAYRFLQIRRRHGFGVCAERRGRKSSRST